MTHPNSELTISGGIATIGIVNPPFNVLTLSLRKAMLRHVLELRERSDVRVVIFESAGGKAFSTGFDISEFPPDEPGALAMIRFAQYLLDMILNLPQITIVKLHGHVLGGGACLLLACDFRIAAADTRIGMPEIKVGVFSAGGGTHMLARQIGIVKAREMVLLGDSIDAAEAERLGLVNKVVPNGQLDEEAAKLADRLHGLSGAALTAAKRSLNCALMDSFDRGQATEAGGMADLFRGRDVAEGVAAFREKRKPLFNR